MRIVSGKWKGQQLLPPPGLPVRPTTDFAKESLFNILSNTIYLPDLHVLELFAGTGNISIEFHSRGITSSVAVEENKKCIAYLKQLKKKFSLEQFQIIEDDVFHFLTHPYQTFDIIFADPPYGLSSFEKIPQLIFEYEWLTPNGIFILEHSALKKFDNHPNFYELRTYGQSAFSFFKNKQ